MCVDFAPRLARLFPPTVSGATSTASDGTFSALNLPADTYTVCVDPPSGSQFLPSCGGWSFTPAITLANGENRTGLQILLLTGSLVVLTVHDPLNALSQSFFLPGVVSGTGGYYRANYDSTRAAYTRLIPQGITAHLFFDTLLVVQDPQGNSLPIDSSVLPFTTAGTETPLSVTVVPAESMQPVTSPASPTASSQPCSDPFLPIRPASAPHPLTLSPHNSAAHR